MFVFIKSLFTVALCFFLLSSVYAQEVISEKIFFLSEDGKGYVRYDTTRTNNPGYDIWFKKVKDQLPEKHLKDYLYMYPNDYKWDATSQSGYDLMKIASGSYATLIQGTLINKTEVDVGDDGVYTYSNWDGKSRMADNHYGIWNKPDNFSQLVYAWVFPQNFNIVSYVANKKGKWVKRNNTITYYGEDVNDLVFTIKYQPRSNSIYKDLLKAINQKEQEKEQILLEQNAKGVKITLAATVLFSSGSSDLSENGAAILRRLSKALSTRDDLNVVIEGHTDNVSIKGALAKKYKSNWELSAARSLTVLHYMAGNNVLESRLESRAHGSLRPIFSNETELGRSKNRRIEILVVDASK
ncbi:MAG: flagellar motor protein MotB [Gammaproteobacteria bacterium]|nr:flagellar motor protein MotB [Gammaproteobacteria bacterium]